MTQHDADGSVLALRTDRLGRRYGTAETLARVGYVAQDHGIFVALTAAVLGATIWMLHRPASWTA
jgi:hypothetical protein